MPPLYILDSKDKYPKNFQIDPSLCEGLPQVYGKYGNRNAAWYDSNIVVCRKGGMDTSLGEHTVENLLLPLYPTTQRKVERCPVSDGIMREPVFVRADSGPGRLSKEADSWEFCRRMWERGVSIIIGLPNGTTVNQDMDQAFTTFQPAVRRSTQCVVSKKLGARVVARKEARRAANAKKSQDPTPSGQDQTPPLADLDDIPNLRQRKRRVMLRRGTPIRSPTLSQRAPCLMAWSLSRTTPSSTKCP